MKKIKNMFEKHDLFKISFLVILITVVLSWIIPFGSFTGSEYTSSGLARLGLSDIGASGVYAVNFFLQQMFFVLFVGIFYGIVSKISGYKVLVSKIVQKFKGKEKVFVLISSFLIALVTSFITQTFAILLFVPLLVNVCKGLNLDKLTTFLCTFGSMIIGILGATYGTEGLVYFVNYLNYYSKVTVTTEIGIRFGILALAYLVMNFFTIRHMSKVEENKKKNDEVTTDLFEISESKEKGVKVWPMALMFVLLFVITLLGYVDWNGNFGITIFDDFHTWLTDLSIGKYTIVSYILGNNAKAFGVWDLYTIIIFMLLFLFLSIVIYRVKWDEVFENAMEGIKKLAKPLVLLTLVYTIFVYIYWSPFTVTIANWILGLVDGFNPFLTALVAGISSIFHIDFGYTGYVLGSVMATYGDSFNIAFIIFVAMNGLVLLVAPTSIFLMFGLSYLDIPYKKWIKYIWKVALILLVLLLLVFILFAYI